MRIAFISYEYPPDSCNGGIATYVYQASRMLRNRGHQVEVFASTPGITRTVERDGIIEHWINEIDRIKFSVPAGHHFANRHREKPFDVIEGPEYNADARIARILVPEVPLVVKMHTPSLLIVKLNRPMTTRSFLARQLRNTKQLAKCLVRGTQPEPWEWNDLGELLRLDKIESQHASEAELVAPPCHALCEYAEVVWKIRRDKIKLSPHPYTPSQQLLDLQPSENSRTVGFVGRLETRKGIETLAAAIPIVFKECPEARFRLIGAACPRARSHEPYDQWLRKKLKPYLSNVEFVGKVPLDEIATAYDSVGICVFPSLWENFPNVCLEAMSAARGIVASNQGGMSDMLVQTGSMSCGVLLSPRNPITLAAEIVRLLRNPSERIRLGHLARQRVLTAYNEQHIGAMMENIYLEAIKIRKK